MKSLCACAIEHQRGNLEPHPLLAYYSPEVLSFISDPAIMSLRSVFSRFLSFGRAPCSLLRRRVAPHTSSNPLVSACSVTVVSRRYLHDHPQGLDPSIHQQYMNLDTGDKVLATYIWIDGSGQVSLLKRGIIVVCSLVPRPFEAWVRDYVVCPGLLKGRILVYVWMLFLHVKLVYYPV